MKAETNSKETKFSYDASGERRSKASLNGETQYPEKYWQASIKETGQDAIVTKHVFIGQTKVCTTLGYIPNYDPFFIIV